MTAAEINAIMLQVVQDMAYEPGYQVNTIALVDGIPDIRHESFNQKYEDFVAGHFWSRTWVNQGADPDGIKAEYPAMFVENRTASQECLDTQDIQYQWDVLIIDKLECPDCNKLGRDRTGAETKAAVLVMLRRFLAELYTYQKWEVMRGEDTTQEWISLGRLQIYEADPEIDLINQEDDIISNMGVDPLNFSEWGNLPDMRAWFVTLSFSFCQPPGGTFNYQNPVVPTLTTTICDTC